MPVGNSNIRATLWLRSCLVGAGVAAPASIITPGWHGVSRQAASWAVLRGETVQAHVFDRLGYTELARDARVPLINLHSGKMADVGLPDGQVLEKLTVHRELTEVDLLCSVPMMKTHNLATVTLSMKNLIGLYPGTRYYSVRSWLHDRAAEAGSPGVAYETIDMVRAMPTGLAVIDGSTAMEGNGPTQGTLVEMNLIVAGTSPLAADMVAAHLMGFDPEEVPTLGLAHRLGMGPQALHEIEIRGEAPETVRRRFVRPELLAWADISQRWGAEEL